MKKFILLFALFTGSIVSAQSPAADCSKVKSVELIPGEVGYVTPPVEGIFIEKIIDKSVLHIASVSITSKEVHEGKGAVLLLSNNKLIEKPDASLLSARPNAAGDRTYTARFILTEADLRLLKTNHIVGLKILDLVKSIKEGKTIQQYQECLANKTK